MKVDKQEPVMWHLIECSMGCSTFVMNLPSGCLVRIRVNIASSDFESVVFVPSTYWNADLSCFQI